MARVRTALLMSALTLAAASAAVAAESPPPAYVVLGAQGAIARAIVTPDDKNNIAPCPQIVVDSKPPADMSIRAQPDGYFNIRVCEYVVGAAKSAKIGDQSLKLPPDKINSIVAFGDTGCRLKADKNATLAARDPDEADEVAEKGKFQACNNIDEWPFAPMSETIAKANPDLDLVVHVGDYYYRESPCPPDNSGCAGSPYGDNWTTWKADFFTPAAPLLKAAPWIVVRGNHENCERGGIGYARLLDPSPATGPQPACVEMMDQYTIAAGDRAFAVLDSSDAADDCSKKKGCDSLTYAAQFAAMNPKPGTWLVTHRPIWGFTNSKDDSGNHKLGIRNLTLQAALAKWNGRPPNGIDLVLSGHIHLWEALSFADERSPQFVLGDGSTELAHKIDEDLVGQPIGGTTIKAAATDHHFGYTIFKPSGANWEATFYALSDKKSAEKWKVRWVCTVERTNLTCEDKKKD
jgi:Calcineurin-like phosphoesterase